MADETLAPAPRAHRPWDALLARRLVAPLAATRVTPNHLTTVRLVVGLAGAAAFMRGSYGWSNLAALLMILSNFLDHADGELARLAWKTSRTGHLYDLASDAVVTVLLFVTMGVGIATRSDRLLGVPPAVLGGIAGTAIALIFYLRMRIEDMAGKTANQQASLGGFETEDILYMLPLVTLCNGIMPFLIAASIGAPMFAAWVAVDYRRAASRPQPIPASQTSRTGLV